MSCQTVISKGYGLPQNGIPLKSSTTDHKEGEQLEDRRSVGASSCNSGDGTDQRVQSLMFMMMMVSLPKLCSSDDKILR